MKRKPHTRPHCTSDPPNPSPPPLKKNKKIRLVQIDYDRTGRSNGRATVVFKREEDAESAVSQFHKRTLDGAPMHVEIVDPPPAPEPRGGGVRGRGATALRGVWVGVLRVRKRVEFWPRCGEPFLLRYSLGRCILVVGIWPSAHGGHN